MTVKQPNLHFADAARTWRCLASRTLCAVVGLSAVMATGCAVDGAEVGWAPVDYPAFVCAVQPVLVSKCSAPGCHGDPARRMRVLAPGRMRLFGELAKAEAAQPAADREAGHHPALTQTEIEYNLVQARGMIGHQGSLSDSPLLNRPLAVSAGGIYHAPAGDVFPSAADPGYIALLRWAQGAGVEMCQ